MFKSLIIMLASLISLKISGESKVVKIATGEWPPFTGEKLKNNGCIGNLVSKIFSSQGYKIEYSFYPWARSYKLAKVGVVHATAYWFDRPDRRKDFLFPDKNISVEKSFFFYKKGSGFDWNTWADLKGKDIVVNRGFTYNQEFWDAVKKFNIKTKVVNEENQNFRLIHYGRHALTIMGEKPAEKYLEDLKPEMRASIVRHPKAPVISKGYLLISRKVNNGKKLVEAFNRGYKKVFSNSSYKKDYAENCSQLE